MNYKLLGNSDLKVSEISFGCMSLGEDNHENSNLLNTAFENGINLFDTADLYQKGQNEITVGKAFKGIREKVYIATKVGNQWREDGSGWDWNPTKAYILKAVDESLKRLQTDYIDLYQLHGGTLQDPIDETIEAFEILKEKGKIRFYGISSIRPNVIREYVKRSNISSVLMQYNLLDRRPEESSLDLLYKQKIGVLARGGLAKGLLVNKPATSFLNYSEEEVKKAAEAVQSFSNKRQSAAAVAIRFILNNPAITSALIGLRTMEQLQECAQIIKTPPLEEDEIQKLREAIPANIYQEHR